MKYYKKIILWIVIIVVPLLTLFFVCGYPIIIKTSKANLDLKYADSFSPFENYDINEGEWVVYLKIDPYDFENLNQSIHRYKLLRVSTIGITQQFKNAWTFKRTGGDVATVSSSLIITRDGENVFECGIVVDENMVGLQSKAFGWAEPIDKEKFIESLKGLSKVYTPFVFI